MIKVVPDQIDKKIPGVVMCSHGNLSRGVLSAVQMVYGACPNVAAIGLEETDDIEKWGEELSETVASFPGGTILLVDLFGGTPCNQCLLKVLSELKAKKVSVIAGLNLGMVLEVLTQRELVEFEKLEEIALGAGKDSVVDCLVRFR